MYYTRINWVFNLKKKFDNNATFFHVNINVKFVGSFHLLDLDCMNWAFITYYIKIHAI